MSPRSSSSSRSPPSKFKNPRPKKTPLTILLSYTATASSLRSQLETDLTTIRKRIRRAKYYNIPQTNLLSIIASIKQLADIYATTAMARNDESSSFTPEGARSPPSSTRQLRPPRPPHAVSSPRQTQQPDCENPYAETIEGRFELMGVPDLGGRRRERYNVFQTGSAGLGSDVHVKTVPAKKPDVHVKTVPVKKPEAVEVGRRAETEKPVRPVYGTVKVIPAKGGLVKKLLENKRN
ncbi:hypothetical protein TWF173_007963 [Orbilia oligospora]|nr:hypothetical protein TWF173_007963 [Orbilia oligospora]